MVQPWGQEPLSSLSLSSKLVSCSEHACVKVFVYMRDSCVISGWGGCGGGWCSPGDRSPCLRCRCLQKIHLCQSHLFLCQSLVVNGCSNEEPHLRLVFVIFRVAVPVGVEQAHADAHVVLLAQAPCCRLAYVDPVLRHKAKWDSWESSPTTQEKFKHAPHNRNSSVQLQLAQVPCGRLADVNSVL